VRGYPERSGASGDGNFYGTIHRGDNQVGTIFEITADGHLTFDFVHGNKRSLAWRESAGALVQGTDGNFYGTTSLGGANGLERFPPQRSHAACSR